MGHRPAEFKHARAGRMFRGGDRKKQTGKVVSRIREVPFDPTSISPRKTRGSRSRVFAPRRVEQLDPQRRKRRGHVSPGMTQSDVSLDRLPDLMNRRSASGADEALLEVLARAGKSTG